MAKNRFVPINLRLPQSLIEESDKLAELEGSNRSELFRNALRSYIERRRKLQAVYSLAETRGKKAGIMTEADIEQALAEIRKD